MVKTANPYKGAPYIDYLKKENNNYYRVFSCDKILYPNWSGAFGIQDVRFLDAMLYDRYQRFLRNFFINKGEVEQIVVSNRRGDLFDRFTGDEAVEVRYNFNTLLTKRFLQLSSVKYLLSITSSKIDDILNQHKGDNNINSDIKRIYDNEINIYEIPDILPRATIFYRTILLDNEEDMLSYLKAPSFDILQDLIIFSKDMNDGERDIIEKINSLPPKKAEPAKITSYTSQKVDIEADLKQPGILMLNDSNYPGWQVYVDGQKQRMLNVDYLFRGVYLESGQHKVEFKYQPKSFYIGLFISSLSLLSVITIGFLRSTHIMVSPSCRL